MTFFHLKTSQSIEPEGIFALKAFQFIQLGCHSHQSVPSIFSLEVYYATKENLLYEKQEKPVKFPWLCIVRQMASSIGRLHLIVTLFQAGKSLYVLYWRKEGNKLHPSEVAIWACLGHSHFGFWHININEKIARI